MKTFSLLFRNKLLISYANCYGHVPFDMFHHIPPQNDTLRFLGENIWVSSIGICATLGYTTVYLVRNDSEFEYILGTLPFNVCTSDTAFIGDNLHEMSNPVF